MLFRSRRALPDALVKLDIAENETTSALLGVVTDGTDAGYVCREAAEVLMQTDLQESNRAVPVLEKQLQQPELRSEAIDILLILGTAEAKEPLEGLVDLLMSDMQSEDPSARWLAARQLEEIPPAAESAAGKSRLTKAEKTAEKVKTDVDTLYATFENRRDKVFQAYRGKGLDIAPDKYRSAPRDASIETMEFAIAAFWNNEQLDAANDALLKYAEYYIDNRDARFDRGYIHWWADVHCRIVEFFGRDGTKAAGRLDPQVENKILEMMWLYVKENSYIGEAKWWDDDDWELTQSYSFFQPLSASWSPWRMIQSENHHIQKFITLWNFSKLLKDAPAYKEKEYEDGHTAAEHHEAWTEYAEDFLCERAKKGPFCEIASGYNVHSLKGMYNLFDFAEDPRLRKLAGNFLHLYYALWAQEQINGVRGGGQSRVRPFKKGGLHLRPPMWFYLGIGEISRFHRLELASVATSDYRMHPVIMDIALDIEGRGVYEVLNRAPGLAPSEYNPRKSGHLLRSDYGGRIRYAAVTPDFIMGMPMLEARPEKDWAGVAVLRHRMGIIFRGGINDRIMPVNRGADRNQQWGVQRKGTMLVQALPRPYANRGSPNMQVWFGGDGLRNGVERAGWLFVEAQGAYAALRPARGGYEADTDSISDSPFVQSEWNSGVVAITKGERELVLEFD